jgi:hypothetical protein
VLKNVSENAVLEISFVGFEMKTFTVRSAGFVNVALGQKLSLLDETVVIAYGQTTRRFATGKLAGRSQFLCGGRAENIRAQREHRAGAR